MAEAHEDPMELFKTRLEKLDYTKQAIWFLNAFWADLEDKEAMAEEVWQLVGQFIDLFNRVPVGNTEYSLDMLGAARLLEMRGETMTANARRDMLKTLDIDNDNRMSLWEYQIHLWKDRKPFKGKDVMWAVKELMIRPQGTNQALEDAKKILEEVNTALQDYLAKKSACQVEIEKFAGKVVKLNRAKQKLAILNDNNLMTDVKFNKTSVSAEAAVRKAMKGENDTCAGEVWWQDRVVREAAKYRPQKK